MTCEILSVGTELLMGQIANTDAQYLSRRLSEFGINVYRHVTVGDNPARVREALREALTRADLVITTGGLGPTEDDLTKEMVAEHFGREMVLDQDSLSALSARMNRLHPGRALDQNNLKQAYFPVGAIILKNRRGTAPGCIVEEKDKAVAILPGPPRELADMFEQQLEPYLKKKTGVIIHSRFLRIFGVGESRVETLLIDLFHLGTPTLALYCGPAEVTARLTVALPIGTDPAATLDPVEREIRSRLGDAVYAEGRGASMAETALELLEARGATLSIAESLTGGMLSSQLVDCPGASRALIEARVTYAESAKRRSLGVSDETLSGPGAVSEACAIEMAEGMRRAAGTDYALSTTGIAGPDGGTEETPVGTVIIGIATPDGASAQRYSFLGDRAWIRTLTCVNALNRLRMALLESGKA